MNNKSRQQLVRRVEAWGDSFTPGCVCGCGEPVPFSVNQMNSFANSWHRKYQPKDKFLAQTQGSRDAIEKVELDKFREAVYSLKEKKSLTIAQLADLGGIQESHLRDILYSKRKKYVTKDFCVSFLRRIGGLSENPSTWQIRQNEIERNRMRSAERETHPDSMPRTWIRELT